MLGSHTLDYSLWLFDDRKPQWVFAKAILNNSSFEGDDEGNHYYYMDDGSFITNHLSINTSPPVNECVINGPLGTMFFAHRYVGKPFRSETDLAINGEVVFKDDGKEWSYTGQLKEFVNAITEKRKPSASGDIGRKVIRAIEAAMESAMSNKVVKF